MPGSQRLLGWCLLGVLLAAAAALAAADGRPPIKAVLKNASGNIVAASDGISDATGAPLASSPQGSSSNSQQGSNSQAKAPSQSSGGIPPAPRPPLGPPTDGRDPYCLHCLGAKAFEIATCMTLLLLLLPVNSSHWCTYFALCVAKLGY